jgi:hypothetical protein
MLVFAHSSRASNRGKSTAAVNVCVKASVKEEPEVREPLKPLVRPTNMILARTTQQVAGEASMESVPYQTCPRALTRFMFTMNGDMTLLLKLDARKKSGSVTDCICVSTTQAHSHYMREHGYVEI